VKTKQNIGVFLFLFFLSTNIFAEGKLTVFINLEENGKLLLDAKVTAISNNDTVIINGTKSKKYEMVLQFGSIYKVEVSKKGYLSKKFTVDTRFPTTLRMKDYQVDISLRLFKLYPEIDYKEYEASVIKINFVGNSAGGDFRYNINSFQNQQKLDKSLDDKIRKLNEGKIEETEKVIKDLAPATLEIFEKKYKLKAENEANGIVAQAYAASNEIRQRTRENAELEYDRIIASAKERAKSNEESNLAYIDSEKSKQLINENKDKLKNNTLPTESEIKEKQKKYDKLANKPTTSLKDSIELHIADLSLQKDKVSKAKYILELMKLRAKTHEDSMLIQEREAEILLAEKEISETEKALLYANNKIQLQEYQIKNQRIIVIGISIFLALVLIFFFVLYKNYKQKQKMNLVLAQKNEEITDSIEYAQKIQTVILPELSDLKAVFSDVFIFFKPKDIVSGDFYWAETIENTSFFSVIDCTGHGVPGAIVSIIGFDGLERAVNEFGLREPAKILDKLNEIVTSILSKSAKAGVKDGMDLAFCSFSYNTFILEFAGAHNPIYIVSNKRQLTENENNIEPNIANENLFLYEIKADRQAIGNSSKPFKNHTIKLSKGDCIYLFSDGFADQFGGESLDKYKYKNFKKLLLDTQKEKLEDQKNLISNTLNNWKGTYEQIDDISIIAIRI
jgi:serine phosphatase RsbU (regulator of sigma subunit)